MTDLTAGRGVTCAFCREPFPENSPSGYAKRITQVRKRVEAGDAHAHYKLGAYHFYGQQGLPDNAATGIELWKEAAGLGSVEAHYELAILYCESSVRVNKDPEKMFYHSEVAAIGGHFMARHNLGCLEGRCDTG